MAKYDVEKAKRHVIENKLLTALEDDDVCAALFTTDDLRHVSQSVEFYLQHCKSKANASADFIEIEDLESILERLRTLLVRMS